MKKKIILGLIFVIVIFFTFLIVTDKKLANQIVISMEDAVDKFSQKNDTISDINELQINELNSISNNFYYNTLSEQQKSIYREIALSIKNLNTKVKIKDYNYVDDNTTMQDVKAAIQNLFLDHPEVFYVNNDYTVSTIDLVNSKRIEVELSYSVKDKNDLNNKISEINDVLNPIVNEAKNMDPFEAELYIHDKICKMATYYKYTDINEVPEESHSIYGCLVSKKAVCDGLSKTFMIALNKVGINNIMITGYLQNQAHAWNMVNLENEWYHVDLTSDKSIKNEKDQSEEIIHSYFNITGEQIKKSNTIDLEEKIPNAVSTKYNYYIKMEKYISNSDNFSIKFKKILDNNKDENLVEFAVDLNVRAIPDKMVYVFQDDKYSKYIDENQNKFNYYNILNTYIVLKNN